MKFLILIHSNPDSRAAWSQMTAAQRQYGLAAYTTLDEELTASGELLVASPLADPSTGRRVTADDSGSVTITDGPFPEMKELVTGFYVVECANLERATEIAGRIPEAGMGLVEVRPTMALSDFLV